MPIEIQLAMGLVVMVAIWLSVILISNRSETLTKSREDFQALARQQEEISARIAAINAEMAAESRAVVEHNLAMEQMINALPWKASGPASEEQEPKVETVHQRVIVLD